MDNSKEVLERAIKIADDYRASLRKMKELGLKVEDMPPDVAEAALRLHQNALMVESIRRSERKAKRK